MNKLLLIIIPFVFCFCNETAQIKKSNINKVLLDSIYHELNIYFIDSGKIKINSARYLTNDILLENTAINKVCRILKSYSDSSIYLVNSLYIKHPQFKDQLDFVEVITGLENYKSEQSILKIHDNLFTVLSYALDVFKTNNVELEKIKSLIALIDKVSIAISELRNQLSYMGIDMVSVLRLNEKQFILCDATLNKSLHYSILIYHSPKKLSIQNVSLGKWQIIKKPTLP